MSKKEVIIMQTQTTNQIEEITTTEKIIKRANELCRQIDWKKFSEDLSKVIILPREGKDYDDLLEITFQLSEKSSLSNDSVYEFTMDALLLIADSSANNIDELRELSSQIEADVYTSDLTAWLNQSNAHTYYLTQAIEEGMVKDGFQALAMAQVLAKTEALDIVINWLEENV